MFGALGFDAAAARPCVKRSGAARRGACFRQGGGCNAAQHIYKGPAGVVFLIVDWAGDQTKAKTQEVASAEAHEREWQPIRRHVACPATSR